MLGLNQNKREQRQYEEYEVRPPSNACSIRANDHGPDKREIDRERGFPTRLQYRQLETEIRWLG